MNSPHIVMVIPFSLHRVSQTVLHSSRGKVSACDVTEGAEFLTVFASLRSAEFANLVFLALERLEETESPADAS